VIPFLLGLALGLSIPLGLAGFIVYRWKYK